MRDLGNVYICGSPFVMSRTIAQNGLYSIFKRIFIFPSWLNKARGHKDCKIGHSCRWRLSSLSVKMCCQYTSVSIVIPCKCNCRSVINFSLS